ncbi:MAG: hypothetical protein HYV07_00110 [Deltaproteobacteria bacterium]|nr:hypothetical protein [Deltaproteobacteria bacterium]
MRQPKGSANELAREQFARDVEPRIAMARGTVVLDENASMLEAALRSQNIRVIRPRAGATDDQIKEEILPNRIIITRNSKDFVRDASSYDYGIIALEGLRFLDPEPTRANRTVRLISDALQDHGLWARRHGFLVTLHEDGTSELKLLTD